MAFTTLSVTENYAALQILRKAHLTQAIVTDIETHINSVVKANIEQLAADVFPDSYVFNNDGAQTEGTDLKTAAGLLADNETVTGNWTFSGSLSFSNTVTSTSTFSSSGQTRAKAYLVTANQSISDATETAVAFNSESFDVGGMHDNSTNNSRLTIPSGS